MNPAIRVCSADFGIFLLFLYREIPLGQSDLSFDAAGQLLRLLRIRGQGSLEDLYGNRLTVTPIGPAIRIQVMLVGRRREWLMSPEVRQCLLDELSKQLNI